MRHRIARWFKRALVIACIALLPGIVCGQQVVVNETALKNLVRRVEYLESLMSERLRPETHQADAVGGERIIQRPDGTQFQHPKLDNGLLMENASLVTQGGELRLPKYDLEKSYESMILKNEGDILFLKNHMKIMNANINANKQATDEHLAIQAGTLAILLQVGFGLLEVGGVQAKNSQTVLSKNLLGIFVGGFAFYAFGFAFAYGPEGNRFIGFGHFFLRRTSSDAHFTSYSIWFLEFLSAGLCATIVGGAVAERCTIFAYIAYYVAVMGFIYPVSSYWINGPSTKAWLAEHGVIDCAGGGALHAVAGIAALFGAIFVGPRIGRFDSSGRVVEMPGHDPYKSSLGSWLLWVGFTAFNSYTTQIHEIKIAGSVVEGSSLAAGSIVATTFFGGLTGALVNFGYHIWKSGSVLGSLKHVNSGMLNGIASVASGCGVISNNGAIVTAFVGLLAFYGMQSLLIRAGIDDPLGASSRHFACGGSGMLMVGLLARQDFVARLHPAKSGHHGNYGLCYGGSAYLLCWQAGALFAFSAWSIVTCGLLFFGLAHLGVLRISRDLEMKGVDDAVGPAIRPGATASTQSGIISQTTAQGRSPNANTLSRTHTFPRRETANTARMLQEGSRSLPDQTQTTTENSGGIELSTHTGNPLSPGVARKKGEDGSQLPSLSEEDY